MNKYRFTAIVRDCLTYPKNLVDSLDVFFKIDNEKDFCTVSKVSQMNYEIIFEVHSKESRDKVKDWFDKTGLKYEESIYTSL